ncbi:MAG TPA: beta-L-arabinofuranosidase domain-containing protein [Spirochaetia bacterium]|nr:beta-L-arabinofuranosidase domain-containing protein [Spirochaetia bacterium]
MEPTLSSLARTTHLLPGEVATRRDRNRAYLMRLTARNLLLSHYLEAGLIKINYKPEGIHWGWDAPTSEIRGTVVGHWLSAAARLWEETGDHELKARADFIVSELARCQAENGGEWFFAIPEKYLYWIKRGKHAWAPQYVCHKNMMGLLDMHRYAGNTQALEILTKAARWFHRFTDDVTREQMSAMMSLEETGGIMELWADLYAVTKDAAHLELMQRYERPELYEPLLRGEDVLTNLHANMTIPEMHGAARAYEVTGEDRYRRIVESYWDLAVRRRGAFATGGQTSGEVWTPPDRQSARLGELNQEHCTVYNLMRLAEYLLRWTGSAEYADYWERNLYNGILAQGFWEGRAMDMLTEPHEPTRGLVAYYLPLAAGSTKKWGSETEHFWCCHCTLLQANANHREAIYYQNERALVISQYLPSRVELTVDGVRIAVSQRFDPRTGDILKIHPVSRAVPSRESSVRVAVLVEPERPVELSLRFRLPWWLAGRASVTIDGEESAYTEDAGYGAIRRTWSRTELILTLPKRLSCWPLPDRPDTVAFLDGPVALAGLVGEEREMVGDISQPLSLLAPDDERHWSSWQTGWKTVNQPIGWRFKPLYEIGNERYTVYFPVRRR